MTIVQLIDVRPQVATVRRDDQTIEIAWSLLHAAQQQDDQAGYVYRWLMGEFCRCESERRQGRPWTSPAREVDEIVAALIARDTRLVAAAALIARDTRRAAEAAAARAAEQQRQDAADRRAAREREIRQVAAERKEMAADDPWWPIPAGEVPEGIRFDTLRRDKGQIVEVSHGTFSRAEAGHDDPYLRVTDFSDAPSRAQYYERREVPAGVVE